MTLRIHSLLAGAALALALAAPAAPALAQPAKAAAEAPQAAYERDRQSILAMAGDYRVRFDFRETVAFQEDYELRDAKVSGGYEAVRVIEDKPGAISLQHILVVEDDGKFFVVKHWRQDWVYQPKTVLTYDGRDHWTSTPVAEAERAGAWSQTVWQTDDSPRYGGLGRWEYDNGVARWTSGPTVRPLARRDAVTYPVYDRYVGVNRHALTPFGWVHEQDNAKVGPKDGELVTYAHEVVLNSYTHTDKARLAKADEYWAATKDYWAEVRAAWDAEIAENGGVMVAGEAENGSVTGPKLMGLADKIVDGETTTAKAVADARALIAGPKSAL